MRVSWSLLWESIQKCQNCTLGSICTHKVPGQGDFHAPLMLIGEAPGEQEDKQGLAFVGPAGQLLTKMLSAIGLSRDEVYICNIVKCRPPHNRQPLPEETQACLPFLRAQVGLVKPKVIVLLGATALSAVLGPGYKITRCHGEWFERKGTYILPTFHPSALLRDESKKRLAWEDLKKVRKRLDELSLYSNNTNVGNIDDET